MSVIIKFPLAGKNAIAEASLPNGARFYSVFIRPSDEYSLIQIPKGPNPRDVNDSGTIPTAIYDGYISDDNFAIKCRGMRAIIDPDSLKVIQEDEQFYVVFECLDKEMTGHYDGQHSVDRVMAAIADLVAENPDDPNFKIFTLHLTEQVAFGCSNEVRDVATASNAVQPQQKKSEYNILGGFDVIKNHLNYCDSSNIGWKQNQRSITGELVTKECSAGHVTNLLASLLPITYQTGASVGEISSWPKRGEETTIPYWEREDLGPLLRSAAEHIDTVLEFSDFVQSSMPTVLGTSLQSCQVLRKSDKRSLNKPTNERKSFSNHLFKTAMPVDHTLPKEIMSTICYALFNNLFRYNSEAEKHETNYSLGEMKAIWLACGKDIINIIEGRFSSNFQTVFNTRWGDFAGDETLWAICSSTVAQVVHNKALWSKYVTTTVKMPEAA